MSARKTDNSMTIAAGLKYLVLNLVLLPMVIIVLHSAFNNKNQEFNNDYTEGLELIWSDEFNIDGKPDPKNWDYEHGFVRNYEQQWYQPQNAKCENGFLIIEGKQEHIENPNYNPQSTNWRLNTPHAQYTSSCLITKGLQEWPSYGYFEIRARFDTTIGAWPAIWLLGTENEWPSCGEIDILEFYRIDNNKTILANVAWGTEKRYVAKWSSSKIPLENFIEKDPDWTSKFHTYSMKWNEESIRICIDGEVINETMLKETVNPDGSNPFKKNKKHYLLLNLAIGSNGGEPDSTLFPLKYEIDYVRVFKNK